MAKPSCLDCKHVKTWSSAATRWEPEDSGWECSLELDCTDEVNDLDLSGKEEDVAAIIASQCPKFEYFNWGKYEADCDKAMAEDMFNND